MLDRCTEPDISSGACPERIRVFKFPTRVARNEHGNFRCYRHEIAKVRSNGQSAVKGKASVLMSNRVKAVMHKCFFESISRRKYIRFVVSGPTEHICKRVRVRWHL
jgi:hypothetical protein